MLLGKARQPVLCLEYYGSRQSHLVHFYAVITEYQTLGNLKQTKMYWLVVLKSGKSKIEEWAPGTGCFTV